MSDKVEVLREKAFMPAKGKLAVWLEDAEAAIEAAREQGAAEEREAGDASDLRGY